MKYLAPSKTFILCFVIISYYLVSNSLWIYFLVYISLVAIYLYFSHIKLSHFRDSLQNLTDVFLSPCDGKVLGIIEEDGFKKVKMRMSLINRWALFLPQTSALELLSQSKGKRHWRGSKKWPNEDAYVINMALKNQANSLYFVKVYPDLLGASPELFMKTGDQGKVGANMGSIFMGGTIVIELPDTLDIVVNINDKVKAGESIIANIGTEA